jgi:uncharacterized hydrophobic protein (TIGR00271 family)
VRLPLRQLKHLFWNRRISPQGIKYLEDSLLDDSTADRDYVVLTVGACAIATFGLLTNSAAVIIGAMLVAPLMLPIRGIAFAALEGNAKLLKAAGISLALGTVLSIGIAWLFGSLVDLPYGSEILARSKPTLLDLGIAVTAGAISGFAKIEPKLSNTLAGTAIAVALMPPVCVIGLGLSAVDFTLSQGAALLYLTNLLGITLSCMLVFLLAGYAPLARARGALGITMACVGILGIPLGASFVQLVHHDQLENSVRHALLDRTITFQTVQLVEMDANWYSSPPEITLQVYADEPITPKQALLLEEFVTQEMGKPFTLVFQVQEFTEVRSQMEEDPPSLQ